MKDKNTLKGWWLFGKYFGYPNCCIAAFLKGEKVFKNIFSGTGFLPCKKCKLLPTEDLLLTINTNRICPEEFTLERRSIHDGEWYKFETKLSKMVWESSKAIGGQHYD